ncbi:HEAT repeat domain-containing protein [Moorena sp. SIOASIH]|uniref:HEAT repeat domain-containing protein n=1 Tax=Moorena sp. SIOASIH TaxID=2607817 RepID=UPI002600F433|nr:HEAT repeat domain-containing protein [Moorena sp. SIOASIH]
MLDLLALWGLYSVGGYLAKEVISPLAKDALEDYTKDFFKESIKEYAGLSYQDTQKKFLGKALKAFVVVVEEELEQADLSEQKIKQYSKPLKEYIKNQSIKAILGSAFKYDCKRIDTETLAKTWIELDLLRLPETLDWDYLGKRYLKEVKTIIRKSEELRSIRDSENIEPIAENTKATVGIIPDFDLRKYQEALLESYGNVKLDSLNTDGSAYNQLKLWKIFIPQNVREVHDLMPEAIHEIPKDYYQKLLESGQLERDIEQKELQGAKERYYQQPMKSVLDVIKDSQGYRYLVVLGDPGSGKSTLLQYLALEWARTDITTAFSLPIPLLIELRTYIRNRDNGQCKDFLEFCHQSSGSICHLNQHHLHDQLKAGKALVMFDGLDEVFEPGKREDVITDIHRFTNKYPKVRVIVTSRVIGYKPQRLRDAEFRHVMLQDLESEQIQKSARWDTDGLVRRKAIKQLAQGYKNHRDTLALLQESARSDTDSSVRGTAIEQLAQGYQDHPDTLALLQESARSDTDLRVRVTAIAQLAQGYKNHRDTLALLQEWARSDTDSRVRGTAVEQLAQGWHDQPWLFEFLCDRTLHDPFDPEKDRDYNPRQVALKAILKYYPNHRDTLPLLQELAGSDTDLRVRVTAIEQLAQGWHDQPWLFEF